MLGLQRHTAVVVAHHPAWADAGREECRRLREIGGGAVVDCQHVGSTAVAGLAAKPILDIAVLLDCPDSVEAFTERMTAGGYVYRGDQGSDGGHLYVRESAPQVRVAHVHVVAQGDAQWRTWLAFRDLLRSDAGLRQRYADLKESLARRFPADRGSYTQGKDAFVRAVLAGVDARRRM